MAKKEQTPQYNPMKSLPASDKLQILEKIGQLFMPAVFINDTEAEIIKMENLIKEHHIGGICFFHSRASAATNFEGKEEDVIYNEESINTLIRLVHRYQQAANYPLLIAIDAEWGLAMRIENTPQFPYAITLGAMKGREDLVYDLGRLIAIDCRRAGIHWNFAPVADINLNPDNPVIGYRSFGEDKLAVSQKALAFMKGMQSEGVLTAAKHFPGHGDTATDSHLGLPVISKNRESLEANEFHPFKQLIKEGVDAVMVGHLAVPALTHGKAVPATISPTIIQSILRKSLGFDGLVVSDALNMHSVSRMFPGKGQLELAAFKAGTDLLCFAENVPEGIQLIAEEATADDIDAAFNRVWKLKRKAFQSNSLPKNQLGDHHALNKRLAEATLTLAKGSTEDLIQFRKEGFTSVEVGNIPGQPFLASLPTLGLTTDINYLNPATEARPALELEDKNVLVALYPPSVKPLNNFGISEQVLHWLNSLVKEKNVILYLFGNPFVLNLLDYGNTHTVVLVFQDFPSFQENATRHFLGEVKAVGKLPVTIKSKQNENA